MTRYSCRIPLPRLALPLCAAASLAWSGCSPGPAEAQPRSTPVQKTVEAPAPARSPRAAATTSGASTEEAFRQKLIASCLNHLKAVVANKVIIDSVAEANRMNLQSEPEILAMDRKWRQTRGTDDPLIVPFMTNACAEFLRSVQRDQPKYLELFVMDAKGCIVGESNKTSDYWQGDEDKWIKCFHRGKGEVFADEITYDESTHSYVVQISVPVLQDGATIGAMTVSVQAQGGQ